MQDILTNPLLMFIPIGLIFYFLVMRPQQQQPGWPNRQGADEG